VSTPELLLRRYLRQRGELGEHELVLDRFTPEEIVALLGQGGDRPAGHLPPPRPPVTPRASVDSRAPARPRTVVPVDPGALLEMSLDQLRDTALACEACTLCEARTQVVFGEGDPNARLMVVGEAPGAEEDRTGRPFVGRAGKLLELFLRSIGFERDGVYICNVLKCRPPGNRNPRPAEIEACSGYLRRQVELVNPGVILAVGTFPAQTLLGSTEPIGRLRGHVHDFAGKPLIPTYHPAAVLRNPSWIRPVWDDLQRLRHVLSNT
jgi:uracil-DNA glycosylase family 4